MKRFVLCALCSFSIFAITMQGKMIYSLYDGDVDFAEVNEFGDTIYYLYEEYNKLGGGSTNVFVGEMKNTILPFKTDSLVIPMNVVHEDKEHVIKGMLSNSFAYIPEHVTSITLPKTLESIGENSSLIGFARSPFQNIYMSSDNPSFSSMNGILYSKDGKVLVAYPPARKDTMLHIEEGVQELGKNAFCCSQTIKYVELPNTLKTINTRAFFDVSQLNEVIVKDSVESISQGAFLRSLRKLVLGKGVKRVHCSFLSRGKSRKGDMVELTCFTVNPPEIIFEGGTTSLTDADSICLYVPRASLHLYQQAEGWRDCAQILPIEPPIVETKDGATVSWVQNFSATGYVWKLYTDESYTQLVMTLEFNEKGYLTNIILGNLPTAPARMSAFYAIDGEEETRFAEYYSFTISSLNPSTTYYYTRQTMSGEEVIDEEVGSFTTLDDETFGISTQDVTCTNIKTLRDGQILIRRGEKTYTLQGQEVK